MKRSVLRIGCAVLSLSAAAGLLASCSLLPPASPLPDSKPAQAEEAPGPAAASLDDGKLRILYSNGSNGGIPCSAAIPCCIRPPAARPCIWCRIP
jgi:hypothetical protein